MQATSWRWFLIIFIGSKFKTWENIVQSSFEFCFASAIGCLCIGIRQIMGGINVGVAKQKGVISLGHSQSLKIYPFIFFFKNGPTPASFSLFSVFFKQTLLQFFYNRLMWKNVMSIQCTAPGFEPTTFVSWASSHNH